MGDEPAIDTRSRIVAAARELFSERGYKRTTLQEIARRLSISKAAVLYHFPTKQHILTCVAEPMIVDLEAVIDRASSLEPERARWVALEGWLDTMLSYRDWLQMVMHDLALLSEGPMAHRMIAVARGVNEIVAGPGADTVTRIRAIQVTAMLGDPVVYLPDVSTAVLREAILAGARRMLTEWPESRPPIWSDPTSATASRSPGQGGVTGPATGPRRGASGRPTVMTADKVAEARRMYQDRTYPVGEIAARLGVSRATLYRHLRRGTPPRGPES